MSDPDLSSQELLKAARDLLIWESADTAGVWPRAAALLGRQSLEQSLAEMWQQRAPGVEKCSAKAQLLALMSYVDESVAEEASHTWWALSRATHHHAYELSPTVDELRVWLESVDQLLKSVAVMSGPE